MKLPLQDVRLEYYEKAYVRELERRREGLTRLSGLMTILSILGGVVAFFFVNFPTLGSSLCDWAFQIFVLIGAAAACAGLYSFAVSIFKGADYDVLNTPNEIDKKLQAAVDASAITSQNEAEWTDAFERNLMVQYREAATTNQLANNSREKRYNRTLRFTLASIIAFCIAGAFYFAIRFNTKPLPVEVSIKGPISLMTQDKAKGSPTPAALPAAPAPAPAASAAPAARPAGNAAAATPAAFDATTFQFPALMRLNEAAASDGGRPIRSTNAKSAPADAPAAPPAAPPKK